MENNILCTIKFLLEKEYNQLIQRIEFMEKNKILLMDELSDLKKQVSETKNDLKNLEEILNFLEEDNYKLE
ncbi:MAG: hypothetical protein QW752_00335, partial [Thermoplasmata archaeon]